MRILIPLHGFVGWNGGLDLIRFIVAGISRSTSIQPGSLNFAFPDKTHGGLVLASMLRQWRQFRAGVDAPPQNAESTLRSLALDICRGHRVILCSEDASGITTAADEIDADVIFPTMLPLPHAARARIGYIFDFQHKYLPQFFTPRVRRKRDVRFAALAKNSNAIVVNSQAVAHDVTEFLSVPPDRILTMPFAPYARQEWFDADPMQAMRRYHLTDPFLIICNHFWVHKDHATALRGFALLRQQPKHQRMQLVMTGDPIDHREPRHYARLMELTRKLGIESSTHFLGLIPKADQLALLRASLAVLQPTLFEGGPGGGSVYEAIGLGRPAVVSDIAINREIDIGDVTYFKAGDAVDLALKTCVVLDRETEPPNRATLVRDAENRLSKLGDAIDEFLTELLSKGQPD